MRESEIESYLAKRIAAAGGEVRKVAWVNRVGAPDRIVMLPGTEAHPATTFWVELKAPGKKPRPEQEREHKRMRLYGLVVHVVDSKDGVDELLGDWFS